MSENVENASLSVAIETAKQIARQFVAVEGLVVDQYWYEDNELNEELGEYPFDSQEQLLALTNLIIDSIDAEKNDEIFLSSSGNGLSAALWVDLSDMRGLIGVALYRDNADEDAEQIFEYWYHLFESDTIESVMALFATGIAKDVAYHIDVANTLGRANARVFSMAK